MTAPRIVIVGAGPAGTRAAETLVDAGHRPVVVDEGWRSGGQIYRRPPPPIVADPRRIYGFEAKRAQRIHAAFDRLEGRIDYRPGTLVWGAAPGRLHLQAPSGAATLSWDVLIVATGAMDVVIPFTGWTLPGVFTLGGAQIALKSQGCVIADRPVFLGTGPLLYLVAWQYARAGVAPLAVLDTAPRGARMSALPGLVAGGRTFLKGAWYLADLTRRGVRLASGVVPLEAEPGKDGAVASFTWRDARGRVQKADCSGVALGYGLRSETALLDLCGARFAFEARQRQWLPVLDGNGQTSCRGVYVAGDGAAITGAEAAELSGERAAWAVLKDLGGSGQTARLASLVRGLRRLGRFRAALEASFPFPAGLAANAADDLVICRCEGIAAGALRRAAVTLETAEINRIKAVTRIGMGRCQGRICGPAAAEILAAARDVPVQEVGRLRPQMPLKPLPMSGLLDRRAA